MWLIIGVSGVTCGGKSTLACALKAAFPNSHLLCQDNFFLPVDSKHHTWIPELNHINWEIMSSIDMEKMWKMITEILTESPPPSECTFDTSFNMCMKDECVDLPQKELCEQIHGVSAMEAKCTTTTKDFRVEKDTESTKIIQHFQILIIEGFLVLNYPQIADICHLKYHLTLTKEQCRERRNKRTYDPPDVPGFFELCIWPEYEKHRDQVLQEIQNVKIIDGSENIDVIFQHVLEDINTAIIKLTSKDVL